VAARGRYAAILDSDDILHPRHVEWLLESQARHGAEICATNMIEFHAEGEAFSARVFARGRLWRTVRSIAPELFVERGMIGAHGVALGYLKPLLDMNFLRTHAITYDERLRIGEDFDLVLRAMLAGGRFVYVPQTSYYYRKHTTSISHRLERADVEGLLRATREYDISADPAMAAQMAARCDNLRATLLHLDTIAAIKAGRLTQTLRLLVSNRQARRLTLASLHEALIKRIRIPGAALASARPAPLAQGEALSARLRDLSQAPQAAVLSS
jgi:succinoglycan biosynthesis protein ExoO